jgi:hypothetical protein
VRDARRSSGRRATAAMVSNSSPYSTSPVRWHEEELGGGGRQQPRWSEASPTRSSISRQPRRRIAARRPPPEPRRRKCTRERRHSENGCWRSELYLCIARRSTIDNGSVRMGVGRASSICTLLGVQPIMIVCLYPPLEIILVSYSVYFNLILRFEVYIGDILMQQCCIK